MQINYVKEIQESEAELLKLEQQFQGKAVVVRLRMLRLLKNGKVTNLRTCADLLNYSPRQVHRWWSNYQRDGMDGLLELKLRPGKPSRMTTEAWDGLYNEVQAGRLQRLKEMREYLRVHWGIEYLSLNGIWWQLKKRRLLGK